MSNFEKNLEQAINNAKRLTDKILIDGKLISAQTNNKIPVLNPSTGDNIGSAPQCNKDDVNIAVESAHKAFQKWKKIPARERGKMVAAGAKRLEERKSEIETLLSLDTGNALRTQAIPETGASIELTNMFAGLSGELKGENYPTNIPNSIHYTTRDPIGVVCAIVPWNAPLFLTVAKIAPAIVAGNSVVLKTAEQAPFCALLLSEIFQQELPPGVLNVISGYGEECGEPLVTHEKVRKVTFTGSFTVGKIIAQKAAPKLCPVTLELGGKNPNIIMSDADLDIAIQGVIDGMRYTRQGQACTAGSRVYIQLTGGDYKNGFFYEPTLMSGVPVSSPVCQEEIFGPVACAIPFKTFDEVMNSANDTPFGLSAVLWTQNLSRALQFVEEIEAGFVQVNQCVAPRANVSYGGLKMSGLGKEYAFDSMINHFTQSKTVLINRGKSNIDI